MFRYKEDYKVIIELLFLLLCFSIITLIIKLYFKPFGIMVVIFFVSSPIYKAFEYIKISKNIKGGLIILFINIIAIMFIIYLGKRTFEIINKLYLNNIEYIKNIIQNLGISNESMKSESINSFFNILKSNEIPSRVITTGEGILSYIMGNICAFFLLVQKEKVKEILMILFPNSITMKILKQNKNLKNMIFTEMKLVTVSTIITIAGFMFLKVDEPIFLGVLCGILDILPYIGRIIVFIPIIIYNIIVNNYFNAIGIVLLYILIQVIREILEAKFLSSRLNIHPIVIFVSIYLGMEVFGILGILVGPLYSIMAKEIIYNNQNQRN